MSRLSFRHARVVAIALGVAACSHAPDTDPRMVSEWMRTLYGAIRVERLSPPVASRLMAYATTALYSGLREARGTPTSLPLNGLPRLPQRDARKDYDATLTAVAAERAVLDSLFREALPTTRAALDRLADSLAAARQGFGIASNVRANSEDLGRRLAYAVIAWSRQDGFDATRGRVYAPPKGLAYWLNDAP